MKELWKRYRELLRKYYPDNENSSTKITQQISQEYNALFAILSKKKKSVNEYSSPYSSCSKYLNNYMPVIMNGFIFREYDLCYCELL